MHPRLPVSPALVRFKPSQTSTVGLVTHANSITLTPGTITVEADRDAYELLAKQTLHALHDATVERDRLRRRVHQLQDELRQVRQMNAGVHQISRAA